MTKYQLRPHHVSRIIDHIKGYIGIKEALEISGHYSEATVEKVLGIIDDLLKDPSQKIQIIRSDRIGNDSICAVCNNNDRGQCRLGSPDGAYNSSDQREKLRYGLAPGTYTFAGLLHKKEAFHPKLRI